MSKIVLKTADRKTTVNRTAVRDAVAHAYVGTSSVNPHCSYPEKN